MRSYRAAHARGSTGQTVIMIAALCRWQRAESATLIFLAMAFLPGAASADTLDRIR